MAIKRSYSVKVTFSTQSGLSAITLTGKSAENFYSQWMSATPSPIPFSFDVETTTGQGDNAVTTHTLVSVKMRDVVKVERSDITETEDENFGKCTDVD